MIALDLVLKHIRVSDIHTDQTGLSSNAVVHCKSVLSQDVTCRQCTIIV